MNANFISKFIIYFFVLFTFISVKVEGQNCTVNAGLNQTYSFRNYTGTLVRYLFGLNGNSGGNISSPSNLLWEIISMPNGANFTFSTPNNNSTAIVGNSLGIPTGQYVFRLGVDCQTGGRVYDSVTITIFNVADFYLQADKSWTECADKEDSIHLIGRPLKTGEALTITGSNIALTYSNANIAINTNFNGPTTDSVRFTIKTVNFNSCSLTGPPLLYFQIRNAAAVSDISIPTGVTAPNSTWLAPKQSLAKISLRAIDTFECVNFILKNIPATNLCLKGGVASSNQYYLNVSVLRLSGSGILSPTSAYPNLIFNTIENRWDTVTPNTLHTFELTYYATSCSAAFKDTIKIFFKSAAPSLNNLLLNSSQNNCFPIDTFPLLNYKYSIFTNGIAPENYTFYSTLSLPSGASATITNPTSKDTIRISGTNIIAGTYTINTILTDTVSGCVAPIMTTASVKFSTKNALPILRDTTFCPTSLNAVKDIKYARGSFGYNNYLIQVIGNSTSYLNPNFINDSTIRVSISHQIPGSFNIVVWPYPDGFYSCTTGRSDTFNVTVLSSGQTSNAGTDQILFCNVNATNLAGSSPIPYYGNAGFWKFLPAISSNGGLPIVIADSANRNTGISGFLNQSSYYFSWNITGGNTGNYCNLQPDTVLVVYSGIPPSVVQSAQADYSGSLAVNQTYNLTSNAPTPTFGVQWNQISGAPAIIVNPNKQNTNITGLAVGNYAFEIVVTNTCGVFKDTVNLNFTNVLPVTLINFSGNKEGENDFLHWDVADEINFKHYELEISEDGNSFLKLVIVPINSTTTASKKYSFTNKNVLSPTNYYRLKMVDNDGRFTYSNIIKLTASAGYKNTLEVKPIPASSDLTITVKALETYKSTIEIINIKGQIVFKKGIQIYKGFNIASIDVGNLPRGSYLLRIGELSKKIVLQ